MQNEIDKKNQVNVGKKKTWGKESKIGRNWDEAGMGMSDLDSGLGPALRGGLRFGKAGDSGTGAELISKHYRKVSEILNGCHVREREGRERNLIRASFSFLTTGIRRQNKCD